MDGSNPLVPPSNIQNEALRDKRWRQIVEATVPLFTRQGFHQTTTRQMAKAVGLSIGTLYEYVRTKEDVLLLTCHYVHADLEGALRDALQAEGTATQRLEHAVRAFIAIVDRLQDYIVFTYSESKSLGPGRIQVLLERETAITGIFADLLREGVARGEFRLEEDEVPLMAHTVTVLGHMWAFRRWALRRQYTLEQYTAAQVKTILSRLGAHPATSQGG